MGYDTNWDIDKYRYHYELDHQWNLKKKFMLAHKEKYPENRLVCLAQLFCNVHYLGCTYEDNIMELINELSKGIAEKNQKWEKQSFVPASTAVEERVRDKVIRTLEAHQSKLSQVKELISVVKSVSAIDDKISSNSFSSCNTSYGNCSIDLTEDVKERGHDKDEDIIIIDD